MTDKPVLDPLAAGIQKLRVPFPKEAISRLPKGNTMLDYVGHAAVTDRLLSVDPQWKWEPMALTPEGLPFIRKTDKELELWIRITILGKTLPAVGTCPPGAFEVGKQLISDALRNGAMRFGVALDLWSKDELESTLAAPPANVNRQTGEMAPSAPKPPPKPAPAAARPAAPAPAAGDLAASIDLTQLPPWEPDEKGVTRLWGVPVSPQVFDGWDRWKGECPIDTVKFPQSKSVLVEHTYASAIRGSVGGRREKALAWTVANAAQKLLNGKGPKNGLGWPEEQKAAAALYQMVSGRLAEGAAWFTPTPDEEFHGDGPDSAPY